MKRKEFIDRLIVGSEKTLSVILAFTLLLNLFVICSINKAPDVKAQALVSESDAAEGYVLEQERQTGKTAPKYAEEYSSGIFKYTVESGGAVITGFVEAVSGKVTVPDSIDGYTVTAIGNEAFAGCDGITEIVLPDTITEIGAYAFWGCSGLSTINIPDSAEIIGDGAFCDCGSVVVSGAAGDGDATVTVIGLPDYPEYTYSDHGADPHTAYNSAAVNTATTFSKTTLSAIMKEILKFNGSVSLSKYSITTSKVKTLMSELRATFPVEYMAAGISGYSYSYSGSTVISLTPSFSITGIKSKYPARKQKLKAAADLILEKCEGKSDFESATLTHDHLVITSQYDTSYKRYSGYDILVDHIGVCQAYSEAFELVMQLREIPCVLVTSSSMNHAWNVVQIEGNWYHIDNTWDDPLPNRDGVIGRDYFMLNDSEITAKNHSGWTPNKNCTSTAFSAMPRNDNSAQAIYNDRWYFYGYDSGNNYGLISSDIYGGDRQMFISNAVNGIAIDNGLFCYCRNNAFYLYYPPTGALLHIYDIPASSDYDGDNLYLYIDSSSILSYWYVAWVPIGDGWYTSTIKAGSDTIDLTDPGYLMDISFSGPIKIPQNGQLAVTPATVPSKTTAPISLSSSNNSVFTVSGGVISGVGQGTARLTASYGGISGSCNVEVTGPLSVSLDNTSMYAAKGETFDLNATVSPAYCEDYIEWSSSAPGVAAVDDSGIVTALAAGTAVITASAFGVSASCTVNVFAPATVTLNKKSIPLYIGETNKLTATYNPSGYNGPVVWSSSDPDVATVDSEGNVTGVSVGTAVISVTAHNSRAECTVTVTKMVKVSLDRNNMSVRVGRSHGLKAVVTEPDDFAGTVTWSSSNTKIATVDSSGKVTGKAAGTATITVKADRATDTCVVVIKKGAFIVDSGTCGDGLEWSLNDDGVLTISGSGAMTDWASVGDVPWSLYMEDIKTVVLPDGITSIGGSAFDGAANLRELTVPDGVTSIGASAFSGCESLSSVILPSSVTSIGDNAFDGCTGLERLYFVGSDAQWAAIAKGSGNDVLYDPDILMIVKPFEEGIDFGLDLTAVTNSSIKISWLPVDRARSYDILRSSDGENYDPIATVDADLGTSYFDDALGFNSTYYYEIEAYTDLRAYSTVSQPIASTTILNAAVLTATSAGYNSVKLKWNKVAGATGYLIYRSVGEEEPVLIKKITKAATVTFTNGSLQCGTQYKYYVRAYKTINKVNYYSEDSNIAEATPIPAAPAKPGAAPNSAAGTIKLTWKAIAGASGYEISRSELLDGEYAVVGEASAVKSPSFVDSTVEVGQKYFYRVRAFRKLADESIVYGAVSVPSASTSLTLLAPTARLASSAYNSAKIAWDKVTGATGYEVWRSVDDGEFVKIATISKGTTLSYNNTKLTAGTNYKYKVLAFTVKNKVRITESGFSDIINATPAIAAPKTFSVARSGFRLKASWSAVGGASSYELYRSVNGKDYELIATTAAKVRTYTDGNVNRGIQYSYKVRAIGKTAEGAYSAVRTATPTLAVPGKFKAKATNYNTITLTWAKSSGATGYAVYRSTTKTGTYYRIGSTEGNTAVKYTDNGVDTGKTYYYVIKAMRKQGNTTGYSRCSAVKSAKTSLGKPSKVTAKKSAAGEARLSWKAVTGADGYEIYRCDPGQKRFECVGETEELTYTDSGLEVKKTYKYRVRAYRIVGGERVYSGLTNAVKVTV